MLDSLYPDPFFRLTLSLLRWHFQTFAAPDSQGWLRALHCATAHVGPRAAGALCYDLVAVVQALRGTRISSFRFNAESCAGCRVWLTPDERRLIETIDAVRAGRLGRARALGQMLCDGNPAEDLIAMTAVYLRRHTPEVSEAAGGGVSSSQVGRPTRD
ncbi:MAG: hypothetical protein ACK4IU_15795 [Tabrizicola flagellatus]|uniref:hypothetical protein n=1 Tax=Tabrizicola flagellatus TaxID=2593021 RepID=UPI0039189432